MDDIILSRVPFRPSGLRQCHTPSSPLRLINEIRPTRNMSLTATITGIASKQEYLTIPPPEVNRATWVWQCHLCHRSYPLGATRRCLEDGHHFCSGESTTQTSAMRRRETQGNTKAARPKLRRADNRACASEFDYLTWEAFGEWRRVETLARIQRDIDSGKCFSVLVSPSQFNEPRQPRKMNCAMCCDSPSQCRWEALDPSFASQSSTNGRSTRFSPLLLGCVGTLQLSVTSPQLSLEMPRLDAGPTMPSPPEKKSRSGPGLPRISEEEDQDFEIEIGFDVKEGRSCKPDVEMVDIEVGLGIQGSSSTNLLQHDDIELLHRLERCHS